MYKVVTEQSLCSIILGYVALLFQLRIIAILRTAEVTQCLHSLV